MTHDDTSYIGRTFGKTNDVGNPTHVHISMNANLPVVPARGGAEVALGI